ncbi:uncharacterized protein LY89DRAFT_650762 [Mollisia scopiformis]|uniref:FAD-binding FR-type domain-containing protein n=1 Tax=Mollisia scopiformis TaxID=149040 RepID=A0A194X1Q6_MOLSC|nr:uncharacterized protein LY89DRAFT_650762 [Mollisia scopiformis]KUJ13772.1 hypothetical protein LY89DRAFT_650762 [Mollisia scopiformis]
MFASSNTSTLLNCIIRIIRSWLLCKAPLFNSVGQSLVFAAYLLINVALTLQNLDLDVVHNWAKRLGWITTCNIAFITFLALKNTPLAFLSSYSYERLNILHQAAGYCTIIFTIFHAIFWIWAGAESGSLHIFLELDNIMGIVAGCAMLVILFTAGILRHFIYEAFYVTHITMFMLVLIAAAMHHPDLSSKSTYITIFAACIWFSDRLLRGARTLWYSMSNRATIHALPLGGVRIIMRRTPWRAVPGSHVFLWIPKARASETHPFTIVSTNPLELVVSPHDGFTRDLSSLASSIPGISLRASCDGPYGTLPNFALFNHLVLLAGGSGATFTFGVALNLIRKMTGVRMRLVIHFIWVVRDSEMQSWFEKELAELSACPAMNLSIYVTGAGNTTTNPKDTKEDSDATITQAQNLENLNTDPEKLEPDTHSPSTSESAQSTLPVILGRPDINAIVRSIVFGTEEQERTIVAACGPNGLMRDTRAVVGDLLVTSGRSVELHCEQFGW